VRACGEARVGVVPYSGGTGLVGGQIMTNGPAPLLLSLERMAALRGVWPEENAMVVEAGMVLADVQAAAARQGRLFPLSLASEGNCRSGGTLAALEVGFSSGRTTRQIKRGLLDQGTEHMEVVGSDNEPVGKVDKVIGDRVVLTRSDSPDGKHHALTCSLIDKVEDGKLILDKPAEEARRQLYKASNRDRFLNESDRNDEGPHMLNRAFSGTY